MYLDRQRATQVEDNRKFLKAIAKVTILCARQDIPLRGHNEGIDSVNKGNFKEILDILASESDHLRHRIEKSADNAKYTSNDTQNDLLKCASNIVLRYITNEVRIAYQFAIIADETRDISKVEQLSICVRYVSRGDKVVNERFLGFTKLHELDANSLAEKIISELQSSVWI